MKKILISAYLIISISCFAQDKGKTATLLTGRETIETIIHQHSLSHYLTDLPYLGYWSGNSWIIVCKDNMAFQAFYGKFNSKDLSKASVPLDNGCLNNLFALTYDDFDGYIYNHPESNQYSSWYYDYFILYDSSHLSYIDCNSMMRKENIEDNQLSSPVLSSSDISILWKIMMPELF